MRDPRVDLRDCGGCTRNSDASAVRRPPSGVRRCGWRGPRAVARPGIEVGPGVGSCGCASRVVTASLLLVIPRPFGGGWDSVSVVVVVRSVGARDADHSRGGCRGSAPVRIRHPRCASRVRVANRAKSRVSRTPDGCEQPARSPESTMRSALRAYEPLTAARTPNAHRRRPDWANEPPDLDIGRAPSAARPRRSHTPCRYPRVSVAEPCESTLDRVHSCFD
jgi:hypothetical protein